MNKGILIIFLGIVLCTSVFLGEGFAFDSTDPSGQMGSSGDSDDTIESGDSSTGDEGGTKKLEGTIAFDPQQYDNMHDKGLGQNRSLIVQEFSDKREQGLNTHIGTFYSFMYHIPMTNLYNTEPIVSSN